MFWQFPQEDDSLVILQVINSTNKKQTHTLCVGKSEYLVLAKNLVQHAFNREADN